METFKIISGRKINEIFFCLEHPEVMRVLIFITNQVHAYTGTIEHTIAYNIQFPYSECGINKLFKSSASSC